MKTRTASLLLVVATALVTPSALAADISATVSPAGRDVGVGIELGAPTSLNFKFMTGSNTGVVLGVGGGIWYDASLSLHADYLVHPLVAQFNGGAFSAYVGLGAWTSIGYPGSRFGYYRPFFESPVAAGARLPLGLTLAFNEVPVEAFIEVVPAIAVVPGFGVFGQGGLGARFYF